MLVPDPHLLKVLRLERHERSAFLYAGEATVLGQGLAHVLFALETPIRSKYTNPEAHINRKLETLLYKGWVSRAEAASDAIMY